MKLKKKKDVTQSSVFVSKKSNSLFSEYADFFEQNKLEELIIDEKGTKIIFRKNTPLQQTHQTVMVPSVGSADIAVIEDVTTSESTESSKSEITADDSNLVEIISPLNGSFYSSPSPDSPVFTTVGATVTTGQELCIVEAMKIFNEIKSTLSGTVTKILAKNGDAVRKGQPLFLIDPA